ncbi:archaemetzincin [bacterium]|nr:archaemetzincin [bacterium]
MDKSREQRKEILIVPVGKVLVDILSEIAVALRKTYKYHVHIGRSEEPGMEMYSDERRQFNAESLTALVKARKRESLVSVLGVVDADMFSGEKNFIFGLHKPENRVALVALSRLREEYYKKSANLELFLRRAVTESIFQVGMTLGLQPCIMKKCILLPTTSLWRLDGKEQTFCDACKIKMERVLQPGKSGNDKKMVADDVDEQPSGGPEEQQLVNEVSPEIHPGKTVEDETEVAAEMLEPEGPVAAEEAAMHTEASGPEEPLDADSKIKDA